MRILALTRYGREGASSRVRFLQFLPALAAAGLTVEVRPLWDAAYLERWYATGARGALHALKRYSGRVRTIAQDLRSFDAVWLEAEMFPYLPAFAERWLHVPYVVDYDDAVYEKYSGCLLAPLLGDKIDQVMRKAAAVVAGNEVVADRARRAGARRVELIPTVVDPARYRTMPEPQGSELRIGWIGTPHTVRYLNLVAEPLRRIAQRMPVRLLVIGGSFSIAGVTIENHAWSEATESQLLSEIHLGIMPLPDMPWERGKSGYKLIQYMAAGRPVVASPVGANPGLVGDAGLLAATDDDWQRAIAALAEPALRARLGARGRERVRTRFSVDVVSPVLTDVLRCAASGAVEPKTPREAT